MYTHGRFTLLYGRNQHNTVKQLSSSLKKKKSSPIPYLHFREGRPASSVYLWGQGDFPESGGGIQFLLRKFLWPSSVFLDCAEELNISLSQGQPCFTVSQQ